MTSGLHWIDGLVVLAYACWMLAIGAYYSYHQSDSDEYFVGNRAMNPVLIGVSLFATVFSTISYLSTPGEIIRHGPVMLVGTLSIPVVYVIVGYLMVPVYMKYKATSAYELLEKRLGVRARVVGASLFVMLRVSWMATLVFFAARAMLTMLGLDDRWLPVVTFMTGAVAIGYSSLGGLRAVVITDVLQFSLLFGGAVLVVGVVTMRMGGVDWFPTEWNPGWDVQPLVGWPTVRITVLGTLLHGTLWWVCTAGGDQTAIQRFMATGDARAATRSFLVNSLAGLAVSVVLAMVGFSLLAYFQSDPQRLAEGMTIEQNADVLFPYFISHHLPVGLSGLVVCGMFAAAMSSVDSGVNSITAVAMSDFVERFRNKPLPERNRAIASRVMALVIGLAVVVGSSFLDHVPGNFLEASQRVFGLFVTPLFLLFYFALFVRRTNELATLLASLVSLATGGVVAYSELIASLPTLSFQWIMPLSAATGFVAGHFFIWLWDDDNTHG